MSRCLRNIFINDKNNYIGSNIIFSIISILISYILIDSKDISVSGGIILGIFQLFVLNTFWFAIELKFKLDIIIKNKTNTDLIIQQFAEHEFLQHKYENFLLTDLKLDKEVKRNYKNIKEAHFLISKMKVDEYFNEFFIYNAEKKIISDVPRAYFEMKIWSRLVNDSPFYYSIQKLTDEFDIETYIDNDPRKYSEINVLKNRKGWFPESFCKLFIISDHYFENDKLKSQNILEHDKFAKMFEYIKLWYEQLGNSETTGKAYTIKVTKQSHSLGYMNEDIGIFGNFYGIQRKRNDDEKKIMKEDAKIDFYFNQSDTQDRANKFLTFFNSPAAIELNIDFFQV